MKQVADQAGASSEKINDVDFTCVNFSQHHHGNHLYCRTCQGRHRPGKCADAHWSTFLRLEYNGPGLLHGADLGPKAGILHVKVYALAFMYLVERLSALALFYLHEILASVQLSELEMGSSVLDWIHSVYVLDIIMLPVKAKAHCDCIGKTNSTHQKEMNMISRASFRFSLPVSWADLCASQDSEH